MAATPYRPDPGHGSSRPAPPKHWPAYFGGGAGRKRRLSPKPRGEPERRGRDLTLGLCREWKTSLRQGDDAGRTPAPTQPPPRGLLPPWQPKPKPKPPQFDPDSPLMAGLADLDDLGLRAFDDE